MIKNNSEQFPQNQETFYVTPSLQNVISTPKGKILDIVLGNDVGVWDIASGRCLKVISGIASQNITKLYPFNPGTSPEKYPELFILCNDSNIVIYDYDKQITVQKIQIPDNLDVQYLENSGDNLVLVGQGQIYYYPNFLQNPTQYTHFETKSYIKEPVDRAIVQDNGNIVFYATASEEVYMISDLDKNDKKFTKIFSNGAITSMIYLEGDMIAVGHNQSIHIIDTQRNCIKNMIKGYNDEYISLLFLKEKQQLVAGTSKASIRIFDIKKCRNLTKFGSEFDIEYHQLFSYQDKLVSVNNEFRRLKVWNIEKIKDVRPERFMKGGLKSVQNAVKINENVVAMLTTRGEFSMGQMNFSQYIEVVDIVTNEHILDKQIDQPGYTIQPESFLFTLQQQNKKEIFYLMKSDDITKANLLFFQEIEGDQKLRKIELNVESHEKAYYSKYGRIIVPYCYNVNFSEILGFSTGQNQTLINSGISIYNFDVKLQLKIQFDSNFLANVIEMIDENNIMFINKDNKLEQWNIPQRKCVEIYETTTDIFSKMKYIDQYFFLFNEVKEQFVIWSAEDEDVVQRRKAKKGMKKIELFDQDCIILYDSGQIELWNVESGEYRYSNINFHVQDFIVQDQNILLIGEGFMKITSRDTL